MGTEIFENENFEEKMKIPANFYKNSFCFSQNQWTFEGGLKFLKMKILKKKIKLFLSKQFVFFSKPMDF